MPNPPDYLHPYEQAVKRHGPSFSATLWASRESQQARFRVIADLIDLRGATIADIGCATGDLASYLAERSIPYHHYIGLDALPELLDEARARNLPHTDFILSDFVSEADSIFPRLAGATAPPDVIVFSGSLNTLEQPHAISVLERAWPAATRALIFNFLSSRDGRPNLPADPAGPSGGDDDPARRFDPLALLDWALAQTPSVLFRQDYLKGHDATIAMLR